VPDITTTGGALLGLLSKGPRSGYDLITFADRSIAHFWPISRALVYRELARLEQLGMAKATMVKGRKAPDKRTYTISRAGANALAEWLDEPSLGTGRVKNEILLKCFFADRMSGDRLEALLDDYRAALLADLADLESITARLDGVPRARYARLTARHGIHSTRAHLAWIEEVWTELSIERKEARTPH